MMKKPKKGSPLYVVVEVERGVAVGARAFRRAGDALRFRTRRQRAMDLDEDDVGMFEISA